MELVAMSHVLARLADCGFLWVVKALALSALAAAVMLADRVLNLGVDRERVAATLSHLWTADANDPVEIF
jgi:hypothetical protein